MSNEENKSMASIEDLLGDPAKKEAIRYIEGLDRNVKVRALTLGDLAKVAAFNRSKGWEEDPYRTTIGILQRGLIEPKLQYSQAEEIKISVATEIVTLITEFSGLSTEAMEQTRNLSGTTTESI